MTEYDEWYVRECAEYESQPSIVAWKHLDRYIYSDIIGQLGAFAWFTMYSALDAAVETAYVALKEDETSYFMRAEAHVAILLLSLWKPSVKPNADALRRFLQETPHSYSDQLSMIRIVKTLKLVPGLWVTLNDDATQATHNVCASWQIAIYTRTGKPRPLNVLLGIIRRRVHTKNEEARASSEARRRSAIAHHD